MRSQLGPVFTLDGARSSGLRKDEVYDLLAAGEIERLGRGVYLRADAIDPRFASLAAASAVQPMSTMCLTSALVYHDLSDTIPFGTNIALPRGTRHPAGFAHVSWHSFDGATFDVGRDQLAIAEGLEVAIYSAERTVVDSFRLMHREGSDVAHEALRRWLRVRGNSPSRLLRIAESFPKAQPALLHALEVLL